MVYLSNFFLNLLQIVDLGENFISLRKSGKPNELVTTTVEVQG